MAVNINTPITANNQKIQCQVATFIKPLPINGPAIGAIAMMMVSVESICAAWLWAKLSRIIARLNIGPTHAPTA